MSLFPGSIYGGISQLGASAKAAGAASNNLLTNLVAYWPLDETGGNALDAHVYDLDLTASTTAPGYSTGIVYANARAYNSTRHYRASSTYLQAGDIDFTIALWWKPAQTGVTQYLVSKWNSGANKREYGVYQRDTDNKLYLLVSSNGSSGVVLDSTVAVTAGNWYFVLAWHDSVNNLIGISINNGPPVTAAHTTGVYASDSQFSVSTRDDGANNPITNSGLVQSVCLWKTLLTDEQKTALYNSGAGLPYSGFDGYVLFDSFLYSSGIGI